MNYDTNTKTGMRNAVEWTNRTMRKLKDGGQWVIPRSGTVVTMEDSQRKYCSIQQGFASDLIIGKVLIAAGWTVIMPTATKGEQS